MSWLQAQEQIQQSPAEHKEVCLINICLASIKLESHLVIGNHDNRNI